MKLAAQIGISITDFWGMTPYELSLYSVGYAIRLETLTEIITKSNAVQAYLTSRWVWQKRVNIKKYLHTEQKPRIMTDSEMFSKIKQLNKAFGGSTMQKMSI